VNSTDPAYLAVNREKWTLANAAHTDRNAEAAWAQEAQTLVQNRARIRKMVKDVKHANHVERIGREKTRACNVADEVWLNRRVGTVDRRLAWLDAFDRLIALAECLFEKETVSAANFQQRAWARATAL